MTFEQIFVVLITPIWTIAIVGCLINVLSIKKRTHYVKCNLQKINRNKFLFETQSNGKVVKMVMYLEPNLLSKFIPEEYFIEDSPLDAYKRHLQDILYNPKNNKDLRIKYIEKGKKYILFQ